MNEKLTDSEYMLSFTDVEMKVLLNLLSQISFKVQELKEHEVVLSVFEKIVSKQKDMQIKGENTSMEKVVKLSEA